ncbi:MAG: GGDEF domain-containing protein [Actinomycetota bacterium]|nr:GGDEF domain-containing protein [Actinomycetota bacterium]
MSTANIELGNHPLSRAYGAVSSSVQLLLDHFELDGAMLLERGGYAKAPVSGRVLFAFGRNYGIREGDEVRSTVRQRPTPKPGETRPPTFVAARALPSLIYLANPGAAVWIEVKDNFKIGPIRVMAALSVIPTLPRMPEHQLVLFDPLPADLASSAIASALMGVEPLLAKVIEDSHVAYQRELLTSQVLSEAERDPLTGVLNRFGWERALEATTQADRGSQMSAILFDLDNLKLVNDTAGHAAGDGYIRRFAEVLSAACRQGDIVARLGGDEFVLLAPGMHPAAAREFSHRIEDRLAQDGVSVSIGYATASTPFEIEKLLAEADRLMYANKRYKKSLVLAGANSL